MILLTIASPILFSIFVPSQSDEVMKNWFSIYTKCSDCSMTLIYAFCIDCSVSWRPSDQAPADRTSWNSHVPLRLRFSNSAGVNSGGGRSIGVGFEGGLVRNK